VLSAFNAKEAMQILEEDSVIHLILIDIGMPLQESLNLIKDIKADKKYKEIPLITIISSEDKVKVLEAGVDDFLVKPVESSKLIFMMKTWLVDKKSI
jgi:PleD family two-component response regulator